jgi:DNA-binding IclR family transcriptional regulator
MLPKLGKRATRGAKVLQCFYKYPVLYRIEIEEDCGMSTSTANRLLAEFVKLGVLRKTKGLSRANRYVFDAYLNIFKNDG